MSLESRIKLAIRDVADFPKEGVVFKDLTPLLLDPVLTEDITNEIIQRVNGERIDAVCAVESRGFLYGMVLAHKLKVPFIPIRKKENYPEKQLNLLMIWNMVQPQLKCIWKIFRRVGMCWFMMIY